ncbi:unnamed protein product [Cyprideis torosa]|uniref:Uncharacterized protein n=1 Tax=Cyprideis torosa TaxID=163714 RepID=A0A7R8ZSC6_9CRUS|nr:unnamed protein product [Cyprideis torosa]CAG0895234.1 unnamed protein product [Cyprideis torosa]
MATTFQEKDEVLGAIPPTSVSSDLRRVTKPSRKKYDDEVACVTQEIQEKEAEIVSLQPFCNPVGQISDARQQREGLFEKKKKIDEEIASLSSVINEKRVELTRLQSNLQYRRESDIDSAIRNLEMKLKTAKFAKREERKIVGEIDYLNRSRKHLKGYSDAKTELSTLRDRQQLLRSERDALFRHLSSLRAQEDEVKAKSSEAKERIDALRADINRLYETKRSLGETFRSLSALYQQASEERRAEVRRRREQEKSDRIQAKRRDMEELVRSMEPYEKERHLCSTLLAYLTQLGGGGGAKGGGDCGSSGPDRTTPLTDPVLATALRDQPQLPGGSFLPRKKDREEAVPVECNGKGKKGRKRTAANKVRPVVLNPDLLSQFAHLCIQPPAHSGDVPAVRDKVKQLLEYYEGKAVCEKREFQPDSVPPAKDDSKSSPRGARSSSGGAPPLTLPQATPVAVEADGGSPLAPLSNSEGTGMSEDDEGTVEEGAEGLGPRLPDHPCLQPLPSSELCQSKPEEDEMEDNNDSEEDKGVSISLGCAEERETSCEQQLVSSTNGEQEIMSSTNGEQQIMSPANGEQEVISSTDGEQQEMSPANGEQEAISSADGEQQVMSPTNGGQQVLSSTDREQMMPPTSSEQEMVSPLNGEQGVISHSNDDHDQQEPETSECRKPDGEQAVSVAEVETANQVETVMEPPEEEIVPGEVHCSPVPCFTLSALQPDFLRLDSHGDSGIPSDESFGPQ